MCGKLKSLLLMSTVLLVMGGTYSSDKAHIDLTNLQPNANQAASPEAFISYLESLKDGPNNQLIDGAIQSYHNETRAHRFKIQAALNYLKTAKVTSTHETSGLKEQVKVLERRVQEAEKKAQDFQGKAGVFVAELSSIRYSAYITPKLYLDQLNLIISSATAISDLIQKYEHDAKIEVLSNFLRLPIVTQQDLDRKRDIVLKMWGEIQAYLVTCLKTIEVGIDAVVGSGKPMAISTPADKLKENINAVLREITAISTIQGVVAFFNDPLVLQTLAGNIEHLLGYKGEQTIPGTLINVLSNLQAFELSSFMYDLHDYIVTENVTKTFPTQRENYYTEEHGHSYKKIKLPPFKIDQISKIITEYEADVTSFVLLSTKSGHKVTLDELKRKVAENKAEQKKADVIIEGMLNHFEFGFKNAVYNAGSKSYVDKFYNALMGKIFAKPIDSQKMSSFKKELAEYGNNFESMKSMLKDFITQRRYITFNFSANAPHAVAVFMKEYWEKKGKPDIEAFFMNTGGLGHQLKILSDIVETLPVGLKFIEDFTTRYQEATKNHRDFLLTLGVIHVALRTMTPADWDAEFHDQRIDNLSVVKQNLRDVCLAQNYLHVAPNVRAEAFNYGLGALGFKERDVWVKSAVSHEVFAIAHTAYLKARDSIIALTQNPIERNYIEIELDVPPVMGSSLGGAPASSASGGLPPPLPKGGFPPPIPKGGLPPPLSGGPLGAPRAGGMPASAIPTYAELKQEYMAAPTHLPQLVVDQFERDFHNLQNKVEEYARTTKDLDFFDILAEYQDKYPNFQDLYNKYAGVYPNFLLLLKVINSDIKNAKGSILTPASYMGSIEYSKILDTAATELMAQIDKKIDGVLKHPDISSLDEKQKTKIKNYIYHTLAKTLVELTHKSCKYLDVPMLTPMEAIISISEHTDHLLNDTIKLKDEGIKFDKGNIKL